MAISMTFDPENSEFWGRQGRKLAQRNLLISSFSLMLAIAVWMSWSVLVLWLPQVGFRLDATQLFMLTAAPACSGAVLRLIYAVAVTRMDGRMFTVLSTLSLLLPALAMGWVVQDTATPFVLLLVVALLAGLGGGSFASAMAYTSQMFPGRSQGAALGMTAGLGNLGIALLQGVGPWVMQRPLFGVLSGHPLSMMHQGVWLQNLGWIWVLPIVVVVVLAELGMDDIQPAPITMRDIRQAFRYGENAWLAWLYLGSFGSYIGFSAVFGLLAKNQFPHDVLGSYLVLGPMLGALCMPLGGRMADRAGGSRLSFYLFMLIMLAVSGLFLSLPSGGDGSGSVDGFVVSFCILFLLTGLAHGVVLEMLHAVCRQHQGSDVARERAVLLGISSALGAVGGFIIPLMLASSLALWGGAQLALFGFLLFYATCWVASWWFWRMRDVVL
ncbi:MAG: MFS transporter [Pseudomonadales bacterium]|nr:MFS transporter [Pseudomonadales bacterium]